MNLAKRDANEMAYLVRQGQEVIVVENGGSRNYIVLVTIARYQLQRQ